MTCQKTLEFVQNRDETTILFMLLDSFTDKMSRNQTKPCFGIESEIERKRAAKKMSK